MVPPIYEILPILFDEHKCSDFLFNRSILFNETKCNKCRNKMIRKNELWRCKKPLCKSTKSIYYGSFFANFKLKPNQVLLIAYLWLVGSDHSEIMKITGHSKNTITSYLNVFRDLISGYVSETSGKIGGPGVIVEIDESKFGKRKYNKGHHVEGTWVFGGVERTPERRVFVTAVPNRKAETLLDFIQKNVEEGSIIYSDFWAAYNNINKKLRFKHKTVNHSKGFKLPDTDIHTNTIEGTWNGIKMNIAPRNRNSNDVGNHLMEFIWRRQNSNSLWDSFINCLSENTFLIN